MGSELLTLPIKSQLIFIIFSFNPFIVFKMVFNLPPLFDYILHQQNILYNEYFLSHYASVP